MGIGDRPATCNSCGKRLGRRQWYYRNNKYYCKKGCWKADKAKIEQEAASAKEKEAANKAESAPTSPEPDKAAAAAKEPDKEEQKEVAEAKAAKEKKSDL